MAWVVSLYSKKHKQFFSEILFFFDKWFSSFFVASPMSINHSTGKEVKPMDDDPGSRCRIHTGFTLLTDYAPEVVEVDFWKMS